MPSHPPPNGFPDDELLALLRDAAVSTQAIAAEMENADETPLPVDALDKARTVLSTLAPDDAPAIETLPPQLGHVLVQAALSQGAATLLAALTASRDKHLAKEAKRAVHLLRAKGVRVEAPRPAPAPAPTPAAEEPAAYMSSLDGSGTRLVLCGAVVRGGIDIAQVVASDELGVISAQIVPLGRKEYRRFVQNLSRASSMLVAEVPKSYARSFVARALDQNARTRRPVPAAFNEVAFVLGPTAEHVPSPGRAAPLSEDWAQRLSRAPDLFAQSEFRDWLPDERAMQSLTLRLDEIGVSPLFIDEGQRTQALRDALTAAVTQYWTAERRALYADRLYDMAHLLRAAARDEHAALAHASAHALESDRPVEAVPFCFAMFESALARLNEHDSASSEAPGSEQAPSPAR